MSAVVELGFSAPAVFTGIDRVEKRLSGLDQNVQKFGRRGGAGAGLGNVSMQLQDIAVQMQSGTRASIIFAQQGSQILSAFGPMGAVAGAVAAVGGALYMAKEAGEEAFRALTAENDGFDASLRRLIAGGSLTQMADQMDAMAKRASELRAASESVGYFDPIKRFFSSTTFDEKGKGTNQMDAERAMQADLARKNEEGRKRLIGEILDASRVEVQIAELRAEGRDKEAQDLEQAIKLRKTLASIESSPPEIQEELKAAALAVNAAEQKKILVEAQKKLEEQRSELAFEELDTQGKITKIWGQIVALREEEMRLIASGKMDALRQVEIETRRVELKSQSNQLEKRASEEAKRQSDELARSTEQRQRANVAIAQEFKLLEARATGRKRAIEDAEREVAIEQRRDRLMRDNGLNRAEATALATRMQNLQERADNGGRATRIRGVQNERRMSGLSDFYDLQRGPSAFDKLQQSESAFDKLQRTPSAFDQLQQRAAQDRLGPQNARNATEPTPSRPIDANEAVNRILTMLPQLMADALTKN